MFVERNCLLPAFYNIACSNRLQDFVLILNYWRPMLHLLGTRLGEIMALDVVFRRHYKGMVSSRWFEYIKMFNSISWWQLWPLTNMTRCCLNNNLGVLSFLCHLVSKKFNLFGNKFHSIRIWYENYFCLL